jgi:hypothetical protein
MEMKNTNKKYKFTPDWLSGFTQSDGSFVVSFQNQRIGIPIRPIPIFNITQSIIELELFMELQKYLGVGRVYKNRNNITYVVKSIDEIVTVILPLFDKHPVRGSKLLAYNIFKEVALKVKDKKHLTLEGTIQIINLAYFMNKETSLRSEITKEIIMNKLNLKNGKLPIVPDSTKQILTKLEPLTLEFVRGLIDGDGSFNVSFRSLRRRIGVNFTVVSELSSISVLNDLVEFFKCGNVYKLPSNAARYQIQTVDEILNNIMPIFKYIRLNTIKQNHYEITVKVCELIKNTGYQTDKDLKTIVDLAWNMNKDGKNRKISKEQYILKFINPINKE